MSTRPIIITLLSILFCLEPIGKIILGSLVDQVSIYTLLEYYFYKLSFIDFFLTFALLPLTGIALYYTKKWSYFIFILVEAYMVFTHGKFFFTQSFAGIAFISAIFFTAIHGLLLGQFLFSDIRIIFFNKSLRFWETDLRYQSDIDIDIYKLNEKIDGKLINISKSGAFFE